MGLSLILGAGGLGAWQLAIDAARVAVVAENDGVLAGQPPQLPVSIEFGQGLCRDLLAGGDVRFVRLPRGNLPGPVDAPGSAAECPGKTPCIRKITDPVGPADLRLDLVTAEPKTARQAGDWVWATDVARLVVQDRDGRVVAVRSRVNWEAFGPGPVLPALAEFAGPTSPVGLDRQIGSEGQIDPAGLLTSVGLRLGQP